MKKISLTLIAALFAVTTFAQTNIKPPVKAPLKITGLDSASYSFGMVMAANLKNGGLNTLNYDLFVKGLKDAFTSQPAMFSEEQAQRAISNLFAATSKQKYAATIAEGKAFFESNKKVPGVITTASGLQYQVIKAGSGEKPAATDKVLVHYKGTLLNGKQFDSSYDRGEPTSLSVNNVIPGWTEGLQLMAKGAKYKFFVPYQLAYGERAAGPDIPAYSNLIFEIELVGVNGK